MVSSTWLSFSSPPMSVQEACKTYPGSRIEVLRYKLILKRAQVFPGATSILQVVTGTTFAAKEQKHPSFLTTPNHPRCAKM